MVDLLHKRAEEKRLDFKIKERHCWWFEELVTLLPIDGANWTFRDRGGSTGGLFRLLLRVEDTEFVKQQTQKLKTMNGGKQCRTVQ